MLIRKWLNYKLQASCLVLLALSACAQSAEKSKNSTTMSDKTSVNADNLDTATFGAGCFWCVEAVFQDLKGVESVTSGYAGGTTKNPTYADVCTGTTGHAEVAQIVYDPKQITFDELLEVFWKTHDPTTLNRQGADAGTQYRSVVFYHNEQQKQLTEKYKKEIDASGAYNKPIVTEVSPLTVFYKAEGYHQNYFNQNGNEPYCRFVIQPKVDKFKKVFGSKLKK